MDHYFIYSASWQWIFCKCLFTAKFTPLTGSTIVGIVLHKLMFVG